MTFVQADLLDGVDGPFDAVLANLPYVAEEVGLAPRFAATSRRSRCSRGGRARCDPPAVAVLAGGAADRAGGRADQAAVARCFERPGFHSVERCATSRVTSGWSSASGMSGAATRGVRAVHGGRRRRGVPGRHGLRARLRPGQPRRGRAAVPAQAQAACQALGGDVLRPRGGAGRAARAGRPDARGAGKADAGRRDAAAAEPGASVPARVRGGSGDAGCAGPGRRAPGRGELAGAAVERQPRRRARPAAARGRAAS